MTTLLTRRRWKPAVALAAAASMIGAGLMLARPAAAYDHDEDHHDNPLAEVPFELRIDLAKAYASPIGNTIMRYVREAKPNADELMDGLANTLGMDPRTAVGSVVLRGEGMNEYDLQLIADLGDTTGKLEGWMLGMPGYESDEIDEQTLLHTFMLVDDDYEMSDADEIRELELEIESLQQELEETAFELREANEKEGKELALRTIEIQQERDELREELAELFEEMEEEREEFFEADEIDEDDAVRVFVALPEANGRFTLVASMDDEATVEMTEAVLNGEVLLDESEGLTDDQVLRLSLADLAEHSLPRNAPGSAVLESITGLTFTLSSGDIVSAEMFMEISSQARARQVTQLLQGFIALTQLGALDQPELAELAELLSDIDIAQLTDSDSAGVTASFSGSHESFEDWVKWLVENAD